MYFASAATIHRGQRGKNKALHYTDRERRGGQGEALLAAGVFFFLFVFLFFEIRKIQSWIMSNSLWWATLKA